MRNSIYILFLVESFPSHFKRSIFDTVDFLSKLKFNFVQIPTPK
jgi:hypothetical protein